MINAFIKYCLESKRERFDTLKRYSQWELMPDYEYMGTNPRRDCRISYEAELAYLMQTDFEVFKAGWEANCTS